MYYSFDPGEARRRHQALLQVAEANRLARRALRHRRAKRRLDIAQHVRPSSDPHHDLWTRLTATVVRMFDLVERQAPWRPTMSRGGRRGVRS